MSRSTQLAELMTKHAAESVRLDKQDRDWQVHRECQLRELSVFLGRLTHAANNHGLHDGKVFATPMDFGARDLSLRFFGLCS